MNSVGDKYELAIQSVKAAFLDDVYRNKGMVTVVSGKMDTFTDELKSTLTDLIAKQTEKVESILTTIDTLNTSVSELNEIGSKIQEITSGNLVTEVVVSNEAVREQAASGELELPGGIASVIENNNVVETPAPVESELVIPGVVTENSETSSVAEAPVEAAVASDAVVEVPTVNEAAPVTAAPVEAVVEAPVVNEAVPVEAPVVNEAAPVAAVPVEAPVEAVPIAPLAAEAPTVNEVAVEAPVEAVPIAPPAAEAPTVNEAAPVAAAPVETPSVNETAFAVEAPVEAPLNETVTVAGSSEALEDNAVATEETIVPFALSPIDEDVTPAVAVEEKPVQEVEQTAPAASPETVAAAIIPDTVPVEESTAVAGNAPAAGVAEAPVATENSNIIKFNRLAGGQTKAILVTGAQYSKLVASRDTQSALMSAKGALPSANDGNTQPVVDDKNKQMEAMLNQANALYQQGNTAEAQAIYNQVSSMNQELQANTTENANVLVKTA